MSVLATAADVLAAFSLAASLSAAEPLVLFRSGEGGYHTYRIPALVRTPAGVLLAFCEGRKGSAADHGDIDLLLRRSQDDGRTWGEVAVLQDGGGDGRVTIGNPAPVVDEATGRVHLLFTRDNDRVFHCVSRDAGATWTSPRDITAGVKQEGWGWYATGPGHGIQLRKGAQAGRLVVPCDHRLGEPGKDAGPNGAHVVYSDDGGESWKLGAVAGTDAGVHPNETTAAELPPVGAGSRLYFNTRDHQGPAPGTRGEAWSEDGGATFRGGAFANNLSFECPVVQGSVLRTGDRLAFSCPNHPDARRDLSLWWSDDWGESWSPPQAVIPGPAAYSDLAGLGDGRLALLAERGERSPYEAVVFLAVEGR